MLKRKASMIINKKSLLKQIFTDAQLELIYDALTEYETVAECIDEENGANGEYTDLLDSVIDIIVD
jgi:hypothetical protein